MPTVACTVSRGLVGFSRSHGSGSQQLALAELVTVFCAMNRLGWTSRRTWIVAVPQIGK